jgi:hypothetical protein
MNQTALKTNRESIRGDGDDPTRGLEDQASADARRDPTAGAPANPLSDPTRGREEPTTARNGNRDASHPAAASSPPLERYRPAGHVVGHAIGDPAPPPRGNRPAGHVVGHAIGDPAPPPRGNRPAGHVIGHGIGDPAPPPRGNRPAGHIVGNVTRW